MSSPSYKEWAKTVKRRGLRTCETCRNNKRFLPDIQNYLRDMASGKLDVGLPQFHEYLEGRGYGLSEAALRKHIARCEAELYGKTKERK